MSRCQVVNPKLGTIPAPCHHPRTNPAADGRLARHASLRITSTHPVENVREVSRWNGEVTVNSRQLQQRHRLHFVINDAPLHLVDVAHIELTIEGPTPIAILGRPIFNGRALSCLSTVC